MQKYRTFLTQWPLNSGEDNTKLPRSVLGKGGRDRLITERGLVRVRYRFYCIIHKNSIVTFISLQQSLTVIQTPAFMAALALIKRMGIFVGVSAPTEEPTAKVLYCRFLYGTPYLPFDIYFHYMRWLHHYTRWLIHYIRYLVRYMWWLFHYMRCMLYYRGCFFLYMWWLLHSTR